jgi:rhodanese-related sulfurtransferase
MQEIDSFVLSSWITSNKTSLVLIDVREVWECQICLIDGSINIPLGNFESSLDRLDVDSHIICICHHGVRSLYACQLLKMNGFKYIYNLSKGIDEWACAIDINMARY